MDKKYLMDTSVAILYRLWPRSQTIYWGMHKVYNTLQKGANNRRNASWTVQQLMQLKKTSHYFRNI